MLKQQVPNDNIQKIHSPHVWLYPAAVPAFVFMSGMEVGYLFQYRKHLKHIKNGMMPYTMPLACWQYTCKLFSFENALEFAACSRTSLLGLIIYFAFISAIVTKKSFSKILRMCILLRKCLRK